MDTQKASIMPAFDPQDLVTQTDRPERCKNCEFDMYGDCDGSGDDMLMIPDTDEV